ncbi:MAG: hypothetical protein KDK07_09865 [Bauldia sp.]|nr:hypothetical protein [Bauldia sp.]
MRKTNAIPVVVFASLLTSASALASAPPAATMRGAPEVYVRQAFSLEEMNCISSDVQARTPEPSADGGRAVDGLTIARESGGGTNGIPCRAKGPPSPQRS